MDRRSYANTLQCATIDNFEKEQFCSLRMCDVVSRISILSFDRASVWASSRYVGATALAYILYRFFFSQINAFFHLIFIAMQTWHFSFASTCLASTCIFLEFQRRNGTNRLQQSCAMCIAHFWISHPNGTRMWRSVQRTCHCLAIRFHISNIQKRTRIPNLLYKPVKAFRIIIILFEKNNCISAKYFVEGNIFWPQGYAPVRHEWTNFVFLLLSIPWLWPASGRKMAIELYIFLIAEHWANTTSSTDDDGKWEKIIIIITIFMDVALSFWLFPL